MSHNTTIPSIGFGTYRLEGESLKQSIKAALKTGFRHIDTAQVYENEKTVGEAISQSETKREDIFLTTKVWLENLPSQRFEPSVKSSLDDLQTDYVDLLLIHWPSPDDEEPMDDYLTALTDCLQKGHTRSIGVSNFTVPLLEKAFSVIGKESIAVNQIEVHPHFQNKNVVEFCQQHNIAVVGYMPLGKGRVMDDAVLQDIAKHHKVTPATIALAWQMQLGIIPIPASTNPEHIEENFKAADIKLSAEEMDKIAQLDTNERLVDPDFAPDW